MSAIGLTGCDDRGAGVGYGGKTMGTVYNVSISAERGFETRPVHDKVHARLTQIDELMSTYKPESDLSRFNASESLDWFDVDAETARVVSEAQRMSKLTGGAFDMTVGPIVDAWGFGPKNRDEDLPSDEELETLRESVGFDRVEVRTEPPALRKLSPTTRVDLSAIAKGYAVDEVAKILDQHGALGYMIEVGGEVRTSGRKGRRAWRIGIERPTPAGRSVHRTVRPGNRGLATSGGYRNFFEHDGVRYSHTIDPRTARPVTHSLLSVTVAAPTCAEADAFATALLVMGPDEGYDFAKRNALAAFFLIDVDGGIEERWTAPMEPLLDPPLSDSP